MTALADILIRRIREDGPMTVASYMAECLLHPEHGYYTTRPPFGAKGDFVTAPEISQMFGELIGLYLAQSWLDQGAPSPFTLAELGPGRGTLMADVLRATRGVPGFHDALHLVVHEASPALRAVQAETLRGYQPHWIAEIGALPDQPLFLIANEFFDALPIHQYQRTRGQWHERLIGLQADHLAFGIAPDPTNGGPGPQFAGEPEGTVVETCPQGRPYMATIQHRLQAHGGLALIVDYGGWRSKGDTLQALKSHAFTDPLAEPGRADLTAHVDFEALAAGWAPYRYTTQGAFLTALGIEARAARLAQGLTGPALENHRAAHHRLTNDAEMGSLFKVLALYGPSAPPPPGFA